MRGEGTPILICRKLYRIFRSEKYADINAKTRKYLEAEDAVLLNQSYTIRNRTFTRADLDTIRKVIKDLIDDGATVDDEEVLNKGRTKRVVFFDG